MINNSSQCAQAHGFATMWWTPTALSGGEDDEELGGQTSFPLFTFLTLRNMWLLLHSFEVCYKKRRVSNNKFIPYGSRFNGLKHVYNLFTFYTLPCSFLSRSCHLSLGIYTRYTSNCMLHCLFLQWHLSNIMGQQMFLAQNKIEKFDFQFFGF